MRAVLAAAAVVACAVLFGVLAPRGGALPDARGCTFQAWNESVEPLSFSSGSASPLSGQIHGSIAALELENLPLTPHPASVTVNDDIAAPAPGGVTYGALYLFLNPIEGACGATVTWQGGDVEKNSTVADTATLTLNDPPFGDNTFSCTATGSLDCSAVALENDHDLNVAARITSRIVHTCAFSVINNTGSTLTGDQVDDPTFAETIAAGATGQSNRSFSYDGCSGDYIYDYVVGTNTTCAPPRVPVYPRCQTVTTYAYVEITFQNDAPGMTAGCAPKDPSMPIACTVTVDTAEDHNLAFTVDVTTGRSTQGRRAAPTPGRDRFAGTVRNDVVRGSPGDDIARGHDGSDHLAGGTGDDILGGGDGNDTLVGNAGEDTILAGHGEDAVLAGTGNDRVWARDGERDVIDCGPGRDYLVADRIDEWRGCESVDLTGRPLPVRRADAVLAADLPGAGWQAEAEPPRLRRLVAGLTGGACTRFALPQLAWDGTGAFGRTAAGPGLAYVATSAATYRSAADAAGAARLLTPRVVLGCLRAATRSALPGGNGWRIASGGATLDVLRAVRGREVVLAAFLSAGGAEPLAAERAIVAAALDRSA